MNIERLYESFIEDRRLREPVKRKRGYDRHHIRPRSLGGTNDPSNIIRLSCQDHLFAHVLLAKIHGGKMALALVLMLGHSRYQGRRSRRSYAKARAEAALFNSLLTTGVPRGPHKEETLAKMRKAAVGRVVVVTEDGLRRIGDASRERINDPARRARINAGRDARLNDPAQMKAFSSHMKKVCSTPEARARLNRARDVRWGKIKSEAK